MEEQAKGFFGKLFDFSFESFITPTIIAIIYGILMVLAGIGAIAFIVTGFQSSVGMGILFLVLSPIVFFLYLIFARIYMEIIIVLFKIAEDLNTIRKRGGGM